jgi:2-polyprenyl-6-methoxyphenol hydroxylase-like FAD-dependent oxidoreductase
MTRKPILISGAGLASLLLARSLLRNNIPFLIFERDASMGGRGQGYRLRLSDQGLDAVESVLDPEAWQKFYDTCGKTAGSGMIAFDGVTGEETDRKTGETLTSRRGMILGIARGDMRNLFLEGSVEHIRWSKRVDGYELTDGGVRAIFSDGTKSVEGSMLIGGEGIRSGVAKQLSGCKLKVFDTGARGIHGQAPTTAFKGLGGEGVFRLRDDSNPRGSVTIITNVRSADKDDPNVQFGWTMVGEPGVVIAPNDDYAIVGKQAAEVAQSLTANWHPRFKPLFTEMIENEAAFWKITCSSPGGVPDWPNEPRVTVIGDAVHSMTPAGGNGANTAMRDSALLGMLISEAGGYKEGVTEAYEKEMRIYGGEAVADSWNFASGAWRLGELTKEI